MARWPVIATALFLLAGCLDSGDHEGPLTRSEYLKKGNAICREADAKRLGLGRTPASGTTRYAQWLREGQAIGREQMARLSKLQAPRSLQPSLKNFRKLRQILSRRNRVLGQAVAKLQADLRNKRSGPRTEAHSTDLLQAERESLSTIKDIQRLLRGMGLSDCA